LAAVALGLLSSLVAGSLVWGVIATAGGRGVFVILGLTLVALIWVFALAWALRGVEWVLSRGRSRASAWPAALGTVVGLPIGIILRRATFGSAPEVGDPSISYAFLYIVTFAAALAAIYVAIFIRGSEPATKISSGGS